MKIYACFSKTHRTMFEDYFRKTLPSGTELSHRELADLCATGAYKSAGFQAICVEKMIYLVSAIEDELRNTDPQVFVFSDVDLRFYGEIEEDLMAYMGDDYEIAFQDDGPGGCCTGFLAIRPTMKVLEFFRAVVAHMGATGAMDQDATNELLRRQGAGAPRWRMLPARYWTFGRSGRHWEPGIVVTPPPDMLVHHANWTRGIDNKILLLEAVANASRPKPLPHAIERSPLGPTMAAAQLIEQERTRHLTAHHPMPLALILQFWTGDKSQAMGLARLIADIEPEKRDDVLLVFARQSLTPMDREIEETLLYCGRKLPVCHLEAKVDQGKRYPGICFDAWSSAGQHLSDAYHTGLFPYHSGFFFEADGTPMRANWIDDLKREHAMTLALGKTITGPRMANDLHVNGTMTMHWSCWEDHPSLHRCPPTAAWDIFHGLVTIRERGPSNIIGNLYGMQSMSEPVWHSLAHVFAWVTSVKDGLHQYWARRNLVKAPPEPGRNIAGTPAKTPAVPSLLPANFRLLAQAFEERLSLAPRARRIELVERQIGTNAVEAFAIVKALDRVRELPGDVCEFGVAQGEASALMANEILDTGANLHLFDSFAGLSAPTARDRLQDDVLGLGSMAAYGGKMACPESMVMERLIDVGFPSERTRVHRGFVDRVLAEDPGLPQQVKFAYFDMDLYEPARSVLQFLSHVVVPGALVVVDDYDFFTSGPKEAVDEFLREHTEFECRHPEGMKFVVLERSK